MVLGGGHPCVGGVLDGLRAHRSRLVAAFIDDRGRVHDQPGEGRHLYVLDSGPDGKGTVWLYAGHIARRCESCGALNQTEDDGSWPAGCRLCGAAWQPGGNARTA